MNLIITFMEPIKFNWLSVFIRFIVEMTLLTIQSPFIILPTGITASLFPYIATPFIWKLLLFPVSDLKYSLRCQFYIL